jgi:hypothetical protein
LAARGLTQIKSMRHATRENTLRRRLIWFQKNHQGRLAPEMRTDIMTLRKAFGAALVLAFPMATSTALGQVPDADGKPCGQYYGSEYSHSCAPGLFDKVGRHSCAYRTGPPCPLAQLPPKRR